MTPIWRSLAAMAFLIFVVGGYLLYLQLSGNFHVVVPGEVYRAAQMDTEDLALWRKEYGIASVLNLRGAQENAPWYREERAGAEALGIQHIDFGMSDAEELTPDQVRALIRVMRDAPKPLLIHCRAGADRTGLASALYVAAIAQRSEWAAEAQLALTYGHVGVPVLSRAWAMNATWEKMEGWLGFPDS